MREKASQGERGAEIGNGVLARHTVPNLNQLSVVLLADSEGGRAGNRKLCSLSTVAVGSEMKCFFIIERRGCCVGCVENITEDKLSFYSRRWNSARYNFAVNASINIHERPYEERSLSIIHVHCLLCI
jgi:hypothetical protein